LIPSSFLSGVEIDDCMMIEDDDRLFLSQGEAFLNLKMNTARKYDENTSHPLEDSKQAREKVSYRPNFSLSSVGPYSVGEVLGRGGFGEVREGTNQLTGEKVALKFIKKSDIQSMGAVEKAAVEIKCQSILRHQNIIKLEMVGNC
jgi:serine/threonine protein kinase